MGKDKHGKVSTYSVEKVRQGTALWMRLTGACLMALPQLAWLQPSLISQGTILGR